MDVWGGVGGGGELLVVPVARFSSPGTGSAMGGLWKRPLRATLAEGQHSALLGGKVQSCDLSCGFCFLIHALGWRAGVFLFLFFFFLSLRVGLYITST